MVSDRRWISAAIAFHLVAITLAAMPAPEEIANIGAPRRFGTGLSGWLTPAFDSLAATVSVTEARAYRLSAPLRVLTRPYVNAGLGQRWNMFANPGGVDGYMRVDYFIAPAPGLRPNRRVQELIFPAAREDQPRWLHQFRDKAISSAYEAFSRRTARLTDVRELSDTPEEVVPIARYFGRRYAARLPPDSAVVRVEVWYGTAPIPPPGELLDPATLGSRLERLEMYRTLDSQPYTGPALGPLEGTGRDVDISWSRLYGAPPL